MDLSTIRESGLLELYVLGECTETERRTVEEALEQFPELKDDLYEIGSALEVYARIHEIPPRAGGKETLLNRAGERGADAKGPVKPAALAPRPRAPWGFVAALGGLAVFAALYFITRQEIVRIQDEYNYYQAQCDSLQQVADQQYAELNQLQDPNNRVLSIQSTGTFANTDLILIYNEVTQQNFVQIRAIPQITDQQSFQLWSLKPGQAPIPLTVFQGDEGLFIPVDFEDNTQTYAITIEPRGGSQAPTLANLIGTVAVPT